MADWYQLRPRASESARKIEEQGYADAADSEAAMYAARDGRYAARDRMAGFNKAPIDTSVGWDNSPASEYTIANTGLGNQVRTYKTEDMRGEARPPAPSAPAQPSAPQWPNFQEFQRGDDARRAAAGPMRTNDDEYPVPKVMTTQSGALGNPPPAAREDYALAKNARYADAARAEREKAARDFWAEKWNWIKQKSIPSGDAYFPTKSRTHNQEVKYGM